jgi:hypothetical protein
MTVVPGLRLIRRKVFGQTKRLAIQLPPLTELEAIHWLTILSIFDEQWLPTDSWRPYQWKFTDVNGIEVFWDKKGSVKPLRRPKTALVLHALQGLPGRPWRKLIYSFITDAAPFFFVACVAYIVARLSYDQGTFAYKLRMSA